MRVAIIDLGTNTFNLLVADISKNNFEVVHKEKKAVKLGKGGINDQHIAPEAFERGLQAMLYYSKVIQSFDVKKIIASATSAMRDAQNSGEFISEVKNLTKIKIQVISGQKEAELIHKGVTHLIPESLNSYMIMDVGGGSTEFIFIHNHEVKWAKSFNIGVSRLLDWLKPDDPIKKQDIKRLITHLDSELKEVYHTAAQYEIENLVGSSGSFDSIHDMLIARTKNGIPSQEIAFSNIDLTQMSKLHEELLQSTLAERLNWPGLVTMRADMMVISSIQMNHVIKQCKIKNIFRSDYALKEGLLFSLAEETE